MQILQIGLTRNIWNLSGDIATNLFWHITFKLGRTEEIIAMYVTDKLWATACEIARVSTVFSWTLLTFDNNHIFSSVSYVIERVCSLFGSYLHCSFLASTRNILGFFHKIFLFETIMLVFDTLTCSHVVMKGTLSHILQPRFILGFFADYLKRKDCKVCHCLFYV